MTDGWGPTDLNYTNWDRGDEGSFDLRQNLKGVTNKLDMSTRNGKKKVRILKVFKPSNLLNSLVTKIENIKK